MADMLEYKGYHGTVEYSAEDRILFGKVFGIRDALYYHGATIEELEFYFRDCIDSYLEICEAQGISPDKEYKGSFNVRMSPELHREAALGAEKKGMSLNQFIQCAIEGYLNPKVEEKTVIITMDVAQLQKNSKQNPIQREKYESEEAASATGKGYNEWITM